MKDESFSQLLTQVRDCRLCEHSLALGPRPIVQINPAAKLLIIGQAPGLKVHQTGIPWNDASGDRLRAWLGLSVAGFYNENKVAMMPMGFCYPGTAKTGDLPPRKECFTLWHDKLKKHLACIKYVLLVGNYAQTAYLAKTKKTTLTETVKAWQEYLPDYFPLPHPSPLNNIWLHKNKWFYQDVVPALQDLIKSLEF